MWLTLTSTSTNHLTSRFGLNCSCHNLFVLYICSCLWDYWSVHTAVWLFSTGVVARLGFSLPPDPAPLSPNLVHLRFLFPYGDAVLLCRSQTTRVRWNWPLFGSSINRCIVYNWPHGHCEKEHCAINPFRLRTISTIMNAEKGNINQSAREIRCRFALQSLTFPDFNFVTWGALFVLY